jgi:hypothetical protein
MTPESKRDLVDISSLSEVPMMNAAATASNPANVFSATNVGGIPAANQPRGGENSRPKTQTKMFHQKREHHLL